MRHGITLGVDAIWLLSVRLYRKLLGMIAIVAFEGTQVETKPRWLDVGEHHLILAHRARRTSNSVPC